MVEYLERICPGVDAEAGKILQRSLGKQGITLKLGLKITGTTTSPTGVQLSVEPTTGGATQLIDTDYGLVAIGRRPFTKGLGVHLVGPSVSELIGEYCVAMAFSASAEDIALTCHPHPTRSEALRQAAMNVEGMATQF